MAIETFALALPHGITLQCRAGGQGPKRVMLLHGFPEAAFVWDELIGLLSPRARCIAPNLRGYAGSSAPPDVRDYRPKHLVTDVAAAIEATGGPLDVLVAHDWGGALAWNLAAQRPELMRRLLMINSPHPATFLRELRQNPEQQQASAYMNWFRRPDAAPLLAEDDYRRLWRSFADAAWLTPALKDRYREVWRQGLEGPLNWYRASPLRPPTAPTDTLHTLELADDAVTVRVPTTLVWGEQDRALRPALLDGLERWVPDLRMVRVADATHWIVHERPALIVAEIERLLG